MLCPRYVADKIYSQDRYKSSFVMTVQVNHLTLAASPVCGRANLEVARSQ